MTAIVFQFCRETRKRLIDDPPFIIALTLSPLEVTTLTSIPLNDGGDVLLPRREIRSPF